MKYILIGKLFHINIMSQELKKRPQNSKILLFRILNKINIHYKYNLNLMKL